MNLTQLTRTGALLACIAAVGVFAAPAVAKTVPSHLRVVTAAGKTLTDHIQYTGKTKVRASKKADCFGSPSSNNRYKLDGANALGLLSDAQSLRRKLAPVLITDAFFGDFGSFGVCGIGGKIAPSGFPAPYWYVAHNYVGASAGANQSPLSSGDRVLYYLTKGNEAGAPDELELTAPRQVGNGDVIHVRVFVRDSGTGERSPAKGASVGGSETNAQGRVAFAANEPGVLPLVATRGDDVPSAKRHVCISAGKGKGAATATVSGCRSPRGELILGSHKRDKIKGTGRADRIKAGGGRDHVNARGGDDRVTTKGGGRDVVDCGKGDDVAKVDAKDKTRRCETVKVKKA